MNWIKLKDQKPPFAIKVLLLIKHEYKIHSFAGPKSHYITIGYLCCRGDYSPKLEEYDSIIAWQCLPEFTDFLEEIEME